MTMSMAGTPKAREKQVSSPKHGTFLENIEDIQFLYILLL